MAVDPSQVRGEDAKYNQGIGDQDILFASAARIRRLSEKVLRDLEVPLTFRQYRTLARVSAGYTSMSQLAARANLTMATVSESVDALVRRGLMESRPSPTDGRALLLTVTPEGVAAAKAGDIALEDLQAELTNGLAPNTRNELDASLRIIYQAATSIFAKLYPPKK